MRSFVFFSLAALAAAVSSPLPGQEHNAETIHAPISAAKETAPIITVVDLNRTYTVNFECAGCRFGILGNPSVAEWQHPPPDSLMLMLSIDESGSALLLNGKRIFPLGPLPPRISAGQIPKNLGKAQADRQADKAMSESARFPLYYEHTLFRAEAEEGLWLQFNVTGLAWGEGPALFQMGKKVLQILLHESHIHPEAASQRSDSTRALVIADIQVVREEDCVQPPRTKNGGLAMIQTAFDPNEWDEYGKFGTWTRIQNLIVGNLGAFIFGCLHCIDVLIPLTLLFIAGIAAARYQSRQQHEIGGYSTETSLTGCRATPPYPDLPVIKIELCD